MKDFQRIGGVAALIEAATYVVGLSMFFAVLTSVGYGSADPDPDTIVAFLVDNQATMYVWNLIIYIVNAIFLVVLTLALYDRLKTGAPALAQTAAAFGLIWATLVLGSGMIANISLGEVANLYGKDPNQAATFWLTLNTVQDGLGGGNEIAGGMWIALVSWAALQAAELPRTLNYLGAIVGVAGLLTVIPLLGDVGGIIFGLGFIVWFVWVGIVLLTKPYGLGPARAAV